MQNCFYSPKRETPKRNSQEKEGQLEQCQHTIIIFYFFFLNRKSCKSRLVFSVWVKARKNITDSFTVVFEDCFCLMHKIRQNQFKLYFESSTMTQLQQSQNHYGWKRPLRSSSPAANPTPWCPLSHIPQCQTSMFLTVLCYCFTYFF